MERIIRSVVSTQWVQAANEANDEQCVLEDVLAEPRAGVEM